MAGACKEGGTQVVVQTVIWSASDFDPYVVVLNQRPKKSEVSGWQLSTRKNFPDEVCKSFLRQKKTRKSFS